MSDDEQVQRSRLERHVFELWGEDRANADAAVIESAALALSRIGRMQPEATIQLDDTEDIVDD